MLLLRVRCSVRAASYGMVTLTCDSASKICRTMVTFCRCEGMADIINSLLLI